MKKHDKKTEENSNPENLKPMQHEGHTLRSRRDFLAQGFLGISAFALAPTALSLLSNTAHAAECSPQVLNSLTPVIIIDLAGGGNIAGSNVMVGGAGGQMDFLASYTNLGLPQDFHPSRAGQINNEMGLVFHSDSGMLRGIQSIASASTRANVEGAIFCSTSDDDTGNNQSNPMYWLHKAGARGELKQLAGTRQSDSGGNSNVPPESINPTVAPVRIASDQDAINLVSLGNRFNEFSASRTDNILNATTRISQKKLEMINRRSLPDAIKALVECGFLGTNDQIKKFTPDNVAGDQDPVTKAIFDRITNQGIRNKTRSISKLVLDGYVGAGTIEMGGYDYHDGTRALGNIRDFELGQVMGAIMELAAQKRKDVVIYVLTDGGVASNSTIDNSQDGRGKYAWVGDSGQRSSTFMMVYKSNGRPDLIQRDRRQIGYFKPNGAVETSAMLTSNSVVTTSKAMVANYLALHGLEGNLENVLGDDPFRSNLDKYLVFNKLR